MEEKEEEKEEKEMEEEEEEKEEEEKEEKGDRKGSICLVSCPAHASLSEKWSGEHSQISYSPKVVGTNEIASCMYRYPYRC